MMSADMSQVVSHSSLLFNIFYHLTFLTFILTIYTLYIYTTNEMKSAVPTVSEGDLSTTTEREFKVGQSGLSHRTVAFME